MRSGIAIGCAVVSLALLAFVGQVSAVQDRPKYVLETSMSVVDGIRPTNQTVYTYYRTFRNSKQELWRITRYEKHAAHWIGSGGRVWVLTESIGRGPSSGDLWVRDTQANELARIHLPEAVRFLAPGLPPLEPAKVWSFNTEESGFTKLDNSRSQFRLVLDGQGEFHVNEVRSSKDGVRYVVTWNRLPSTNNQLDELFIGRQNPKASRPLANENTWEVWQAQDNRNTAVLAIYHEIPSRNHRNVSLVKTQYTLDALPSYVAMTPSKRVLWFTFAHYGAKDEAILTIYGRSGAVIGEIDLKAAGGFGSARRAQASLNFTNVQIQKGRSWVDLQQADWYYTSVPETIKIVDARGYRYIIKIEGYGREGSSVVCERLPAQSSFKE